MVTIRGFCKPCSVFSTLVGFSYNNSIYKEHPKSQGLVAIEDIIISL
jgi:hypothetical protein